MPVDLGAPAAPLAELRSLRRSGLAASLGRVRELLGRLPDPLDAEAAGALLSGRAARADLAAGGALLEQRIAVLASSTVDPLPHLLTAALVRDGVLPQVRMAGFDQWRLEVLAGAPALADLAPRITALLLDDAAVFRAVADPVDVAAVEAAAAALPEELAEWARAAGRAPGGLVVLTTVPLHPLRRDRLVDLGSRARLEAAWLRMNAAICELADRPGVCVLSADAIAGRAGRTFATDRMRHVAGHAYSPEFLRAYAEELAAVARADLGRARKVLVLDLDHTLWGGVVGDDGVAALRLGGGYPGSAHTELQALARDLAAQGVLLAVASKNDEAVAREALATHPEMVLGPESFAAVRANWQPKPDNLRSLAAELNLGADSLAFADDNPVERGLMRELLPEVATVELPADPAGYAATVAAAGLFTQLRLTGEDRERTGLYRAGAARETDRLRAGSLTDYLSGLDSRLTVEELDAGNGARLVQLFAKTNQFNLTGRRYTAEEVAADVAAGRRAYFAARLTDRFGDNGLIAAAALGTAVDGAWTIDNLVLSCRVFSRNVEQALLGLILAAARDAGAPAVCGEFVPSPKNSGFADFYPGLGFAESPGEGTARRFRHGLDPLPDPPSWVHVPADQGVFHAA